MSFKVLVDSNLLRGGGALLSAVLGDVPQPGDEIPYVRVAEVQEFSPDAKSTQYFFLLTFKKKREKSGGQSMRWFSSSCQAT